MKHKHLTLENRIDIQTKLTQGESLGSIARFLNKSPSRISGEMKKHRLSLQATPYGRIPNSCLHRHSCEKCAVCEVCRYKRPKEYCRFCKHCTEGYSSYKEDPCLRSENHPMSVIPVHRKLPVAWSNSSISVILSPRESRKGILPMLFFVM